MTEGQTPQLARGKCPELSEVTRLLRDWLKGDGLRSLPVDELKASWDQHCVRVEGANGLFPAVISRAPRLAPAIGELREEHQKLDLEIEELMAVAGPGDGDPRPVVEVLVHDLETHCARSVQLVYEAFDQDIGGG